MCTRVLQVFAAGAVLLAAAGCTGTTGESGPTGGAARVAAVGNAVTVNKVFNHANGSQLQVDRLLFHEDNIELDGGFTNGGEKTNEIGFGKGTYLADDKGRRYDIESPDGKIEVTAKTDRMLGLSFEPAIPDDARKLSVHINDTPDAGTAEYSTQPRMIITDVPTNGSSSGSLAAAPVAAKDSEVHANGTQAQIDGISFSPNRIGVRLTLTNGGDDVSTITGDKDGTYAVDDLGNRYPVLLPESAKDNEVRVAPGNALDGVLVFAGRLHPDATQLTIRINARFGSTAEYASHPEFQLGPYPVGDPTPDGGEPSGTPLPNKLGVHEVNNHRNGTQFRLRSFSFDPDTTTAKVSFDNGSEDTQTLNPEDDEMKLVDEYGNGFPILPPSDNRELTVAPGRRIDATLAFSGRIDDDATKLWLVVNNRFGSTAAYETDPWFRFGPYNLTRPRSGAQDNAGTTSGFAVGLRSDLPDRKLGSSSAREVARTASKYDGRETDDGVRLTVPTKVLFGFDSAKLRPDGRRAVGELADVLDYYGDAPTRVIGHTDSVGSRAYNRRLSANRARTVTDSLVDDHGITRSRLTPVGRGEANPVARNTNPDGSDNPAGRQKNRRVVLEIKTDKGLPH